MTMNERTYRAEALAEAADDLENLLAEHESGGTTCHEFGRALSALYRQWRSEGDEVVATAATRTPPPIICFFDDYGQPMGRVAS